MKFPMKFISNKSAPLNQPVLVKKLVKELEHLHWTGKDARIISLEHCALLICIWSEIQLSISNNVENAREFIRRGGLQWVYWYVVEKGLAAKSAELNCTFKEIMIGLAIAMTDEGKPLFKNKYYGCRKIIEERLFMETVI
ncbi:uncharacterized protein LOC110863373 [Folsomia candida]|uniref:Uncharacterized protein n=1 Tax=Folsomia candida TaxID=158441 RepID=A0A226F435_FOLCA|nr:uncharacterized protein LOC110863373 [Folsomia candida]OXA63676.1 hypothetical protein Fcan01_01687 [Folsomia candida]